MKNKVKTFWVNLPVKDVAKSRKFFKDLGFIENEKHSGGDEFASFFIDENKTVLMLFKEDRFAHFANNPVCDTAKSTEVFLNLDAPSREYVDEFSQMVDDAGGNVFAKPQEVDGWMYLIGFADIDGHRWGMLYMDETKMG